MRGHVGQQPERGHAPGRLNGTNFAPGHVHRPEDKYLDVPTLCLLRSLTGGTSNEELVARHGRAGGGDHYRPVAVGSRPQCFSH